MASLAATLVNGYRTKHIANFDKNEQKRPVGGAFFAAQADSMSPYGFVTPELITKARNAAGITVSIPVINYDSTVTVGSTRPVTITDDENVSALQALTFVIYNGMFTMTPARHWNNEIDYQVDFNKKLEKMIYAMLSAFDSAVVTALDTNKNQVTPDLLGKYTFASNVLNVPALKEKTFYSDLEILMMSKDMNSEGAPLNVIGNPYVASQVKYLGAQGGDNYENLAYQFDGKNFYFTNNISNATGYNGTMYFMPQGSLGLVTRNEPDALMNSRTSDGKIWDIVTLPIINMPADSYYYEAAIDRHALDASTAHLTRAKVEYFCFTVEMAVLTNYNSALASVANPIIKAAIAES